MHQLFLVRVNVIFNKQLSLTKKINYAQLCLINKLELDGSENNENWIICM